MKKKAVFLLCFLSLFLSGCSELDEGAVLDISVNVEENVDISSIEYPKEVHIYTMDWWEADTDKICGTLLRGEISEIQTQWAIGPAYITDDPEEEILYINTNDGPVPASFNYGYKYVSFDEQFRLDTFFPEHTSFENEFWGTSKIKGTTVPEDEVKEMTDSIEESIDQLGLPEYTLRAYALIPSVDGTQTDFLSFWQQTVDQIPLTISTVDLFSSDSQRMYNRKLDYDPDLYSIANYASIDYVDGELVSCRFNSVVDNFERIDTVKIVSPRQAWNKVKEDVYQKRETRDASLELFELQYLHLIKNEKQYLYPVWTIEVIEADETVAGGVAYNYYLIDAVTGDFFVGINRY